MVNTIGKKASNEDFPTKGNLDLFNSNSSEPSKTINISPIVPKIGRIGVRSGIESSSRAELCLTAHPKTSSKITVGIFVLGELKSKTYAKRSSTQIVIIIGIVNLENLSFILRKFQSATESYIL